MFLITRWPRVEPVESCYSLSIKCRPQARVLGASSSAVVTVLGAGVGGMAGNRKSLGQSHSLW